MYQKYLLQSKLLTYKTIEQLKIQLDRHQMEMGQPQGYIDRLEHELHYYKNAAVRLQNQVKFLRLDQFSNKPHLVGLLPFQKI